MEVPIRRGAKAHCKVNNLRLMREVPYERLNGVIFAGGSFGRPAPARVVMQLKFRFG